jgi:outer membrane protein OmpA-like peptidoglycan-associated protein
MKRLIFIALLTFCTGYGQHRVTVFFEFDEDVLDSTAIEKIDNTFAAYGRVEVSKIYGFCDWKGTNGYNDSLSVRRVRAVFDYLKRKSVAVKPDFEIRGFGEDFEQSDVQAENRKVVIVFDEVKPAPESDMPLATKIRSAKVGDRLRLRNINFRNNSAVIVEKSKPVLYDLLCALEENPNLKIEILGHICCQPKADINDISTARARAVYNFLVRNKISRKRLSYRGLGISQPIFKIPERNEAEADENRRVEIRIVEN